MLVYVSRWRFKSSPGHQFLKLPIAIYYKNNLTRLANHYRICGPEDSVCKLFIVNQNLFEHLSESRRGLNIRMVASSHLVSAASFEEHSTRVKRLSVKRLTNHHHHHGIV